MSAPERYIELNPRYASLADVVGEIARDGLPADAETVYRGRNHVVRFSRQGYDLNVKAFHVPALVNGVIYGRWRETKARRSFANAMALSRMGFGTPDPVAFIEERRGGRLLRSYYICLHLQAEPIHRYEFKPQFPQLCRMLAADLVKMHRSGVFMADFTPGNFIVTDADDPERIRINYVDLNRVKFGVKQRRILRRTFNSPFYADIDVEAFLRDYASLSGRPLSEVTADALAARRRYNRIKRMCHPLRYIRRKPR